MTLYRMYSVVPIAMGGGEAGGQDMISLLLMMGIIFGIFYFLVIRPQKQQQQEHEDMVSSLSKGDDVITAGGIHGEIESVTDDVIQLKVTGDVTIKLNKSAVSSVKGADNSDEQ